MARVHSLQYDERNKTYFVWIRRCGVSKYFNFGKNRKKAQNELHDLEHGLATGRQSLTSIVTTQTLSPTGKKDMRIEELFHQHLEMTEKTMAKGTFENRRHYLQVFLDYIGESMVSDITRIKLETYYAWAKQHHGKSENGGNEHMRHVKTALRWGEEMELIELSFHRFPEITETLPETKRLNNAELMAILQMPASDIRDLIVIALHTGSRPIEIRELKQNDVYYTTEGTGYIKIAKPKTRKMTKDPAPREIPLTGDAEEIINRQVKKHPQSPYIFLNAYGTPYTRYSLRNKIRRICTKIGIRSITPYAFRHTFASIESDSGTETNNLARLMGHTTTRTLRRYVSNSFDAQKKAVDKVGVFMQGLEEMAKSSQKLPPKLPPTNSAKYQNNTDKQKNQ